MTLKKESFNLILSNSHLDIITNNSNCKEFKLFFYKSLKGVKQCLKNMQQVKNIEIGKNGTN